MKKIFSLLSMCALAANIAFAQEVTPETNTPPTTTPTEGDKTPTVQDVTPTDMNHPEVVKACGNVTGTAKAECAKAVLRKVNQ